MYATNPVFALTVQVTDDLGQSSSATVTVRLNSAGSSLVVSGVQSTSGVNALVDTTGRLPSSTSGGLGAANSFVGDSPSVAAATGAAATAAGNLFALLNLQGGSNPLYGVTALNTLTPLFQLHGGNLNPWFIVGSVPVLPTDSGGVTTSTLHSTGSDSNGAFTLDETFQDTYSISRNLSAGTYAIAETVNVFNFNMVHPLVAGNGSTYSGSDILTLNATGSYTPTSFTVATIALHEAGTENSHTDQAGPALPGNTSGGTALHVDGNDTFVLDASGPGFNFSSLTLDKTGTESFQLTQSGRSTWHTDGANGSTTDGTASFALNTQGLNNFHQNQQEQTQSGSLVTTSFTRHDGGGDTFSINQSGTNAAHTVPDTAGSYSNSSEAFSVAKSGAQTYTQDQSGLTQNGSLAITNLTRHDSGNDTFTVNDAGTSNWHLMLDANGSYSDGTDSFTLAQGGTETYTQDLTGNALGGTPVANSLTRNDTALASFTLTDQGTAAWNSVVPATSSDLSSSTQYGTDSFTMNKSGQDTFNQQLTGHDNTATQPVSFAVDSLTSDDAGTDSFTLADQGSSFYSNADGAGSLASGTDSYTQTKNGSESYHQHQTGQDQNGVFTTSSVLADGSATDSFTLQDQSTSNSHTVVDSLGSTDDNLEQHHVDAVGLRN